MGYVVHAFWLQLTICVAAGACLFPSQLTGVWFQKGWQAPIRIEGNTFSIKGTCVEDSNNMYLIEDSKENCFRCILIHSKHFNVLQYRETYCDEHRTLEEACSSLTVDNHLHTMFKMDSSPVPCPFRGPFSFSYSRGGGWCGHPPSTADACTHDSQLLFRFQACADVLATESSEEELTCLATWKEGSAHYLVGKMKPKKDYALPFGEENYYRCFVYEKDKDTFDVSQSADPTCDGLISPRDGSRIMKLTKTKHPMSGCIFPSWVTSVHHWHALDGRTSYLFGHRNTSYKVVRSGHPEIKVTCTEEVYSSPNVTTVVAYSMQGCSNGFVCLTFHPREKNIIEIQIGEFSRRPHDACSRYGNGIGNYITLIAHSGAVSRDCPRLTETDGLRVSSRSQCAVAGCRITDSLHFVTTCDTQSQHMNLQCQGQWEDNGRNYLITGLKGSKIRYCLVYYTLSKITYLSGLLDTCKRTIIPGVTGNLTFNITAASECVLNQALQLSVNLILLTILFILVR